MSYDQNNPDRGRNLDTDYSRSQGQQFDSTTNQDSYSSSAGTGVYGSNTGGDFNPAGGTRGRPSDTGNYGSNIASSDPDTEMYGKTGPGYDQGPTGEGTYGRGAKPGMGEKIRGGAEELVGKTMGRPDLVERGQERKGRQAGEFET